MTFGAWIGLVIAVAYVSLVAGFLLGIAWCDRVARRRAEERDKRLRDVLAEAAREHEERKS